MPPFFTTIVLLNALAATIIPPWNGTVALAGVNAANHTAPTSIPHVTATTRIMLLLSKGSPLRVTPGDEPAPISWVLFHVVNSQPTHAVPAEEEGTVKRHGRRLGGRGGDDYDSAARPGLFPKCDATTSNDDRPGA